MMVHVYRADRLPHVHRLSPFVVLVPLQRVARATTQVLHRVTVIERLTYFAGQQRLVAVPEPVIEYGVQQRIDGRVGGAQPLSDRERRNGVLLHGG